MFVADFVLSELPYVGIVESTGGKEEPGEEDAGSHGVEIRTLKKSHGGFDDERTQHIVRHPRLMQFRLS